MWKTTGRKVAVTAGIAPLLLIPAVWANWAEIFFLINFDSLGRNEQGSAPRAVFLLPNHGGRVHE